MFCIAEVIIFGDSNVLKYLKRFTGPKTIPTFTFSELKQNIKHLKQEKFIIIHVLTNDVTFIHKNSDSVKFVECFRLASDFIDFITNLSSENANKKIIVSEILPRFDKQILNKAGKIINEEITKKLQQLFNVYLLSNDYLEENSNFLEDCYHLTPLSFDSMFSNWKSSITSITG